MKKLLRVYLALFLVALASPFVAAQANGNLQIHFIDTGQGDAAVLGHPTAECLERLHQHGVKTFWTETGNGDPDPAFDTVGGNIIVEVAPNGASYTVHHGTASVSFPIAGGPSSTPSPAPMGAEFAWSKKSNIYHFANCKFVNNISPDNLQTGTTPPAGKTLHKDCPR